MRYCLVLLFLFNYLFAFSQERFPTNFNADSFNVARNNSKDTGGRMIAISGFILDIRKSYRDKEYYIVDLGNNVRFGVALLFNDDNHALKVGDAIKALGYLTPVDSTDKMTNTYYTEKLHLLCFCFVNLSTKKLLMLPGTNNQVTTWMNGKIP